MQGDQPPVGYKRDNHNFVVGRLLRDLEAREGGHTKWTDKSGNIHDNGVGDKNDDDGDDDYYALCISVFEALWNDRRPTQLPWTWVHAVGLAVVAAQLGVAAVPLALTGDWSVLLVTFVGTVLVQWTGALPQWTAEKLPRRKTESIFAMTSGNGRVRS